MGTTALVLILEGSAGGFIMNFFLLSSVISLSLAAPAPEAEAKAALVHPVLAHHVAPLAVVPVKQLQWPGITAPGVDSTCLGCRHAVVVGRKRREAEADAEADADAEAEAEAEAKVEALGVAPVTSLNGYIHNLGSGNSYAAISSGPSYPLVHAVAPFPYPYLG